MPTLIEGKGKTYYQCDVCKLIYNTLDLAQQCENWCREHKSCNLDIIQHAVKAEEFK